MKNQKILDFIRERITTNTALRIEFVVELSQMDEDKSLAATALAESYRGSIHTLDAMIEEDKVLLARFRQMIHEAWSQKMLKQRNRRVARRVAEHFASEVAEVPFVEELTEDEGPDLSDEQGTKYE